jgi:hypothetical protein
MLDLLLPLVLAATSGSSAVRVTPFFSRLHDGPSFLIECRNLATQPLPPDRFSAGALRIDGKLHPVGAVVGGGLGARTAPVKPGETWSQIIVVDQSEGKRGLRSAVFGAQGRIAHPVKIDSGKHRIAFQCGDAWSDDVDFFWEQQ